MIGRAIMARLAASSAVAAIVGTRISPLVTHAPSEPPYLVYTVVGGEAWNSMSGQSGMAQARVQVDAYALTYAEAQELAASVRAALDNFRGTAGGVRVGGISRQTAPVDFYEADVEPRLFRVSQDFIVTHDEA
jgi:hypothetical protein